MILYYVRHGDPIYNPDSLTPLGERQAEAVAKRLALYGVDRIYSSTSNRAYQTSLPLSELLKKEVVKLDFANESHVAGEFCAYDSDGRWHWLFEYNELLPLLVSREVAELGERWYEHPGFGERSAKYAAGVERVNREVDAFLAELGYEHDRENRFYKATRPNDERVALFAHAGFGRSFLSSLLDIPYPEIAVRFMMGHSGVTVINFRDRGGIVVPQILTLANDSHLYREGIMTGYNNTIRF